jgi:hypothetical protein
MIELKIYKEREKIQEFKNERKFAATISGWQGKGQPARSPHHKHAGLHVRVDQGQQGGGDTDNKRLRVFNQLA